MRTAPVIVQNCVQAPEERIVITHGTTRWTETAAAVVAAILKNKTVVLTGAMVPYAFGSSDGLFNLGSALSFVQVLPPGVYIAMNGKCFAWDCVRKNRERGEFEEVPASEGIVSPTNKAMDCTVAAIKARGS